MNPNESYLAFFSKLFELDPFALLSLFFLGLMRFAPIVSLAPFLGNKAPSTVKMGLLICLTLVFLPQMIMTSQTIVGFNFQYIVLCFKELFLGFVLAFFITIPFYIAETAGVNIDFLRGSSALQVTDPFMQTPSSSIGIFYNYIMIVIFYQINGIFYFFNALFDFYTIIPADKMLSSYFFTFQAAFWQSVWTLVGKIVSIGIQLAAPSIIAILMTEMFLGIANRLAPQVQIAFLGMSLKSLLGLAVLCAAWFFILQQMGIQSLGYLKDLEMILKSFQ
ncbi:EscT/YscT/HrcT family type III secretion system export apparatus protein [Candidatus Rhabdochlamydia porcellionis]|jgi:type III secretion protein T|uniref:Bacterial export protein n=1 Tax=Candidatus Rhabdochlamydia porcellionis TaxID=225148 RepID=A0A1K0K0Y1_9BACT|nr:flagellar biosynthetic protein FliR [Candidatus Rhabdochlamydia porcellionis]QZA59309.1 Bacterial export protein [Candidatus Rhabdochlamydia porcellionis]SDA08643.1 Type III secretion inner membrane protein [Candidatus Rhabdochlamydia porcellionis]